MKIFWSRKIREWDSYIAMLLENKFWRMVAGKEPLLEGEIGRFIGDLKKASLAGRGKLEDWEESVGCELLAKEVAKVSVVGHCIDLSLPETYADDPGAIDVFFARGLWGEKVWGALSSDDIPAEHRACLDWNNNRTLRFFNSDFARNYHKAAFKQEVDELMFRNMARPSCDMGDIPRKYWTPRMRFWDDLVSDPVEWDIYKIWEEIENLRAQGSSEKNRARLKKLESEVRKLSRRKRPYLDLDPAGVNSARSEARKRAEAHWDIVVAALNGFIAATNKDLDVLTVTAEESVEIVARVGG